MSDDPLSSPFVQHVLKYRPEGVTARMARELKFLRERYERATQDINWMLNHEKLLNPVEVEYLEEEFEDAR